MDTFSSFEAQQYDSHGIRAASLTLVGEAPLLIRVQGHRLSLGMRTPGEEIPQAAGFCLAEGIVDAAGDITGLAYAQNGADAIVDVTLSAARWAGVAERFEAQGGARALMAQVDSDRLVAALADIVPPFCGPGDALDGRLALDCLQRLDELQPLRAKTRAAHAAAVFRSDLTLLTASEDVGRHNAVDKAVGRLLLDGTLRAAALLVLSSRISFDLVQKAARAGVAAIFSMSRPTRLAVQTALRLNMTLACLARPDGLLVFCGKERIGW
ncbi:MAG: formate dehydrogenase accessory sulfurtransferase FdhD [Desulfobacterales bacterium]|jgi:FdhD protein|nr:formate dehydrogenase accessory sulfurtransferase FdhD [Desulfobacterales bacterium]